MAIEDSKLELSCEDMCRIGVITGSGMCGLDIIEEEHKVLLEKGPKRVSPFLIPMIITNFMYVLYKDFGETGEVNYKMISPHFVYDDRLCGGRSSAVIPTEMEIFPENKLPSKLANFGFTKLKFSGSSVGELVEDYELNFHHTAFDFKTLSEDLYGIGFKEVYNYEWRDTEHGDIDDFSQSYIPHMDKESGMLMHLNIEAIK